MTHSLTTIGRSTSVDFPDLQQQAVPARVDTGAKTSAVWASNIVEKDGKLHFVLFDTPSQFYNGRTIITSQYDQRMVANSSGDAEMRYAVRLRVHVEGRKIKAMFTLANRETQVYPVLVARNILRGKFIVDVKQGKPLIEAERIRSKKLKQVLAKQKGK